MQRIGAERRLGRRYGGRRCKLSADLPGGHVALRHGAQRGRLTLTTVDVPVAERQRSAEGEWFHRLLAPVPTHGSARGARETP